MHQLLLLDLPLPRVCLWAAMFQSSPNLAIDCDFVAVLVLGMLRIAAASMWLALRAAAFCSCCGFVMQRFFKRIFIAGIAVLALQL
ncbi:uncharacterized protein LOC127129802 isoform X2 [Lathyrus oleraceus]|nr:uncharacterized protein LOC127129802 isoform X2 [Pisum sativum]